MERLTQRLRTGEVLMASKYEEKYTEQEWISVLQDRLKVGDTVWVTRNPWTGKLLKKPLDAYVNGVKMYSHGIYVNLLFDTRKINGTRDYEINHIGKTVFLTREEAEKALEAMKDAK